jgi:hypothetical protein
MKKRILALLLLPLSAFAASISEMVKTGEDAFESIVEISNEVNQLVSDTQNAADPLRLQCVGTKQASILALKDISEVALSNLQAASTEDKAAYELRKITLSKSKVQQFYNEAQRCTMGMSAAENDGGKSTLVLSDTSNVQDMFGGESQVSSSESYSFDSSNTSAASGTEGINPPPATSPF